MKKIGIFNNKGGVAKTTSVINLAYSFQNHDKRVLVVDCDQQENCFGFFMANKTTDAILHTDYDKIDHTTWTRYSQLPAEPEGYDYVIFDMPPMITDEVRDILRQCDTVYVPVMIGEFEISGLRKVTDELNQLGVKLGGVFVTMYQAQYDSEILEEVRRVLGKRLMKTVIPFSNTVRRSLIAGLPIEAYFTERGVPKTKSSWKIVNAYEELAMEVMRGEEDG